MNKDNAMQIISTLLDEGYDGITLIREYPGNEEHISITVGIKSPIDKNDFDMKERVIGRIMPTLDSEGNPASIMVFDNG